MSISLHCPAHILYWREQITLPLQSMWLLDNYFFSFFLWCGGCVFVCFAIVLKLLMNLMCEIFHCVRYSLAGLLFISLFCFWYFSAVNVASVDVIATANDTEAVVAAASALQKYLWLQCNQVKLIHFFSSKNSWDESIIVGKN